MLIIEIHMKPFTSGLTRLGNCDLDETGTDPLSSGLGANDRVQNECMRRSIPRDIDESDEVFRIFRRFRLWRWSSMQGAGA